MDRDTPPDYIPPPQPPNEYRGVPPPPLPIRPIPPPMRLLPPPPPVNRRARLALNLALTPIWLFIVSLLFLCGSCFAGLSHAADPFGGIPLIFVSGGVCALAFLLSIYLAVTALQQIRQTGERGRDTAVAALVVDGLWVVLCIYLYNSGAF